MIIKDNKKCRVCGEPYRYCNYCSEDNDKPAYMNEFHSQNCHDIFKTCSKYNMGMLTKEEAASALEELDLSKRGNYESCIERDLKTILGKQEKKDTK